MISSSGVVVHGYGHIERVGNGTKYREVTRVRRGYCTKVWHNVGQDVIKPLSLQDIGHFSEQA
jgi:hypothetical protein